MVPYSKDDPDEGRRYAGSGAGHRVDPQSDRVKEENQSSSKDDDSDTEGNEELPLFLRRDIPSVEDSPEAHNLLEGL